MFILCRWLRKLLGKLMPTADVTIRNVSADEPGGSDLIVSISGAAVNAKAGAVAAGQAAGGAEVSLEGAEAKAQAGTVIAGSEFVLSRNVWGGMPTSAIGRAHEETDSLYLWARCALFVGFQPQFMWSNSERPGWYTDWQDINNTNPLALQVVHQAPLHNTPGFRTKTRDKFFPITNWAQSTSNVNRKDVALSLDATDQNEFNTNSQKSTTNILKQAGWNILITTPAVQDFMASIACDALTGSNNTGLGFGLSYNSSAYMTWMHDGSDVVLPKSGSALRNVRKLSGATVGTGNINTIVSSNSQQPIIVRLSKDVELAVLKNEDGETITLDEDPSFGKAVETDAIWFWPNTGTKGFIGFHVLGYKPDESNRCQIYLKSLSKIAHSTQLLTPAAGWNYVLNDQKRGTIDCDWNRDGENEDAFTIGQEAWNEGWKAYWDQVDTKMTAAVGHGTLRGWSQASSHLQKRTSGLPNPHGQTKTLDFLQAEETQDNFRIHTHLIQNPEKYGAGHGYNVSNTWIDRGMRMIHFFLGSMRDNPGGFVADKPRGPMIEYTIWGEDFSDVNEMDASILRFFFACNKLARPEGIINHPTVEDLTCPMTSQLNEAQVATPIAIEEYWIDFNTNWSTPAIIGEYDPGGGPLGNKGHPEGIWYWATADAGNRIYMRRLGNWLCIANLADNPANMPTYLPSHLPNGHSALNGKSPYTPRPGLDFVEPADFTKLYTDGVLAANEKLRHFEPSTYVNEVMTHELLAKASSVWTGFEAGPARPHPSDGTHVLSTVEWMARDRIKNDGSTVDTSVAYGIAPIEAVFLEIYE